MLKLAVNVVVVVVGALLGSMGCGPKRVLPREGSLINCRELDAKAAPTGAWHDGCALSIKGTKLTVKDYWQCTIDGHFEDSAKGTAFVTDKGTCGRSTQVNKPEGDPCSGTVTAGRSIAFTKNANFDDEIDVAGTIPFTIGAGAGCLLPKGEQRHLELKKESLKVK